MTETLSAKKCRSPIIPDNSLLIGSHWKSGAYY
jgi:hypothetical protein